MINIQLCNICGKRVNNFPGRLILSKNVKQKSLNGYYYERPKTIRSWKLCNKCLNNLSNIKTDGDKIEEDINRRLDTLYLNKTKYNLLKFEDK